MKRVIVSLLLLLSYNHIFHACPTCIGIIKSDSPPFFSAEFNTTTKIAQNSYADKKVLDLYAQYIKNKGNKK